PDSVASCAAAASRRSTSSAGCCGMRASSRGEAQSEESCAIERRRNVVPPPPSAIQRSRCIRNVSANDEMLDEFCDALWLEDGLARNTLESYRRDLRQFGVWLKKSAGKHLLDANHGDIQASLGYQF